MGSEMCIRDSITKEALQGQKVVKAYGGYSEEESAFLDVNRANQRRSLRRAAVAAVSVPMLLLIAGAGVSGIIYLALTDTIGQFVSAGTFVSYMGAILLLMSPIKRLARINEYIQAGLAAAGSVFRLIDSRRSRTVVLIPARCCPAPSPLRKSYSSIPAGRGGRSTAQRLKSSLGRRLHWWGNPVAASLRSHRFFWVFIAQPQATFSWTALLSRLFPKKS